MPHVSRHPALPKAEFFTIEHDENSPSCWSRQLALPNGVDAVLNGDRSQWYWMRLPDGELVLACYPQEGPNGTYLQTEQWRDI